MLLAMILYILYKLLKQGRKTKVHKEPPVLEQKENQVLIGEGSITLPDGRRCPLSISRLDLDVPMDIAP